MSRWPTRPITSSASEAIAAEHGRDPGISVSFRPILGATDDLAWERAYRILDQIEHGASSAAYTSMRLALQGSGGPAKCWLSAPARRCGARRPPRSGPFYQAGGSNGAAGNSTALVGSPETVAQALIDYYNIGVSTFLIRGYNPYDDAVDYGRELIPRVRELVSHLEKEMQPLPVASLTGLQGQVYSR